MLKRPRRNRKSQAIRDLLQETHLHPSDMILPLFVMEGQGESEKIPSMPGIERLCVDRALLEVRRLYALGLRAIVLFAVVPKSRKDAKGSEALREGNLMQSAIKAFKQELPQICVMTDIALDPYTDHGHDGLVDKNGYVMNDPTVEVLAEMALGHARAGADLVAPSDMMDGRVGHIRKTLDDEGYESVGIMAYTAKYASSLYSPFREALHSAPTFGHKTTYQMNPANVKEALLEADLDESEGADMLLIKPALSYLDVLAQLRQRTSLPLGAYHVSGEYCMIMAAAQNGWLDASQVMYESVISIKRAGADYILTYGAASILETLATASSDS